MPMEKKYTDKFFKIPVLQYSSFDLYLADEQEEDRGVPISPPSAVGKMAIDPDDIISYHEGFTRGTTIDDVIKDGFDITNILLREDGTVSTIWSIKEFEDNLNEFMKNNKKTKDT